MGTVWGGVSSMTPARVPSQGRPLVLCSQDTGGSCWRQVATASQRLSQKQPEPNVASLTWEGPSVGQNKATRPWFPTRFVLQTPWAGSPLRCGEIGGSKKGPERSLLVAVTKWATACGREHNWDGGVAPVSLSLPLSWPLSLSCILWLLGKSVSLRLQAVIASHPDPPLPGTPSLGGSLPDRVRKPRHKAGMQPKPNSLEPGSAPVQLSRPPWGEGGCFSCSPSGRQRHGTPTCLLSPRCVTCGCWVQSGGAACSLLPSSSLPHLAPRQSMMSQEAGREQVITWPQRTWPDWPLGP